MIMMILMSSNLLAQDVFICDRLKYLSAHETYNANLNANAYLVQKINNHCIKVNLKDVKSYSYAVYSKVLYQNSEWYVVTRDLKRINNDK